MNKRKNDDRPDRNIFIGIGIVCVIGLVVLLVLFNLFTCPCKPAGNDTVTAIVATNDHIATLLMQTSVAATEWFNATNTPLP